jgi:phosphatidylinositol kinase/protein kinase (PI-3  family)
MLALNRRCEWGRHKNQVFTNKQTEPKVDAGELQNQKAIKILASIDRKLQGHAPSAGLPLSVPGQVHELITIATDPKNLSAMYLGWAPYL